jgi:DNA-binding GntR family transcriptional regulator
MFVHINGVNGEERMPSSVTWQAIQAEALRRIRDREWKPGEAIPHEAELAGEFGCARATVNRALRELAEAGLLERRRKAGTRVSLNPVRKATFEIPIIRQDARHLKAATGLMQVRTNRIDSGNFAEARARRHLPKNQ